MTGPRKQPSYSTHSDKDLIAEQPGRAVLFTGIALALVVGLIFRGLMSPIKVRSLIESAATRMHKEVQVEFEGAQISLSRGLLPRFAVVVTNVKMLSDNECWMKPILTADELRLPLSLWSFLQGENPITRIEAGEVHVTLRSPYKNCQNVVQEEKSEAPALKRFVTLKDGASPHSRQSAPPQVKALLIDRLRVSLPHLVEPLELLSLAVRLKSNTPRVVEVTANTHLMKDAQVGDYLSYATVWGEYSEFPVARMQTRISGNWREGSYHLKANYGMKTEELMTEVDLKHIPLSLVFQIFKKFQWLKEDYNGRQIWVSLNAQSKISQSNFKAAEMQVKNLLLEGDLGDLAVEEARIVSLDPVKYFPFNLEIKRLDLDRLLLLFNQAHPSKTLGRLGIFDGRAEITDQDHIKLAGTHRGMEFIFSNKGQRAVQVLKEFSTKAVLDKNFWQLQISQIVPEQGRFDGQLEVQVPREGNYWDLKVKASELQLSPSVVKLMTADGELGGIRGGVNMRLQDGRISQLKGQLNAEAMDIEGVQLEKLQMNFDTHGEVVHSQTQAQNLRVKVGAPAFRVMKDLVDPSWMSEDALHLKNLSSQFEARSLQVLEWKNFTAQLAKGGRLQSEGSWNAEGQLSGQVQTVGAKQVQRWTLGGFRDEPRLILIESGKKKKSP